jgi:predicted membrane protein
VELQQAQEQSVRIVTRGDIMSVVLGLIVIVRKMVTEYYKVESIFLHSTESVENIFTLLPPLSAAVIIYICKYLIKIYIHKKKSRKFVIIVKAILLSDSTTAIQAIV